MANNIIVSKQDANQVLRLAFDDESQSLRITGSSIPGSMTVDQADGTKLHVTVDASALPDGAATEVKQDDQIAQLADIQTASENTAGILADVVAGTSTIKTDVVSSALPTGAATEAKQDDQITVLGSVETNTAGTITAVSSLAAKTAASLVAVAFDEMVIDYVASGNGVGEIETVTYKLSSSTVATVTLSYDAQNRLTGVVRS